jgi:hypothetical protein
MVSLEGVWKQSAEGIIGLEGGGKRRVKKAAESVLPLKYEIHCVMRQEVSLNKIPIRCTLVLKS